VLFHKTLACALLVTLLAACGGGSNNAANNAANTAATAAGAVATAAGNAANTVAGAAGAAGNMAAGAAGAMANKVAQAIPATLHCGTDQPVWVNSRSHAYFEPSSPFYGKTKSGQYMCPADAVAAGYHKASGKHRRHGGGSMEGAAPSPAST
jgi:hypothetical protein